MFVDANIFIIAALQASGNGQKCREFIKKIEAGEQRSITSVLVLDEVLNSIEIHTGSRVKAKSIVEKILSTQNLEICEVNMKQFGKSIKYFEAGLRPRDALHVAVMLEQGVTTILSFDRDFDSIPAIKRQEP
ncbi:tRNA(fMet)-specific endonuclease VapC [Candidatus Gugararchaeum adminiculabundum]|nr:tRNA(fMet)-specific endonuclease VapC [Candidatus Gugararchaeum adminiculabundum]